MKRPSNPDWVFEQLGIGRWSRDVRTGTVTWDARMREITGHDEPLSFHDWVDALVHADDREQMRDVAARADRNQSFDIPSVRVVRPNGEVRWVHVCGRPGTGDDAHLYHGVALDMTDDVLLQKRLAQAERFETLGRFSAGVSHNFNNMLMVVNACLHAIGERIDPTLDRETVEDLADAVEATGRAARVVEQIAQLARSGADTATHPVSVAEVCDTVARLVHRALPDDIALVVHLTGNATVDMVPGGLEQVLQNLLFNARDALVAAGTADPRITLAVAVNRSLEPPWVEVLVTDNGPGVATSVEDTLFEPFVTTKGRKGTGLGLASSSAIVRRHGGHLAHRRGGDGGAEFLVSLPAISVTPPQPREPVTANPAPATSRARVLVIDDERAILRTVARALERGGFAAETASGRDSVERLLQRSDAHFDIVLLDRSLGPDHGRHLLELLRARLPQARVLYFTGEPLTEDDLDAVDGLVKKPVDLYELLDAVNRYR